MLVECVICYEHLQSADAIYHTPCGHVFHFSCLTQWLKRSKTCPECRERVVERKISRLFLNFVTNEPTINEAITSSLQTQISGLNHELLIKELEIIESNSNNSKLSMLLKLKDNEINILQTNVRIAQEDNKIWKNHLDTQRSELESVKKDVACITKERDDLLSDLATCTNRRWELQNTVVKLQQELTEVSEARMFFAAERTKKREMESNLASLEIEKLSLQRRIEELEDIVESGVKPDNFVRHKDLQDISMTTYSLVPLKKRKVDTTDRSSEAVAGPATPIDVIDLTIEQVQPLIDLTKDAIESLMSPAPSPTCWPLVESFES